MQSDHSIKQRRLKSREVSSRFLSPPSSDTGTSSPTRRVLSPLRQKQSSSPSSSDQKFTSRRHTSFGNGSGINHGLWPSSSSSQNQSSLADHLGNERLIDFIDRKPNVRENSDHSLNRQNSCMELSRFEKKLNRIERNKPDFGIGGSTRYVKERTFSARYSNTSSTNRLPLDDQTVFPGRRSIDENLLRRRRSDSTSDTTQDSEPDSIDLNYSIGSPVIGRSGIEVDSKYLRSSMKPSMKNTIKRANSGNGTTKWSLSPGRSALSPMTVESKERPMSISSMKPPTSPSKTKGMGNLLSKGLELFKIKKSSTSSNAVGVGDGVHHLRLLNNRLVQWRYVNAKCEVAKKNVANQAEMKLIHASASLFKLEQSVMQKRQQLAKQKMEMKLNYVLHSQIRLLECWGNIERQHISSISKIKESLHSVVCKLPLVEGATLDTNSATINLRQASDLSTSIMSLISTFSPEAEKSGPILWELAKVVTEEKLLLDEFLELYMTISKLEAHERSLRCNIIQMKSQQQPINRKIQ
ncbi:QWRF motif-containing protein 3 [Impatiens glandulifera]|uniref:QWRF motif-containing protein 3 n=1 Tax=Impatiens glandulifera TaxID=253017 RepID=UPI001FB0525A|nr:QWRF motif-containing protein 3 [Impatiens glandulifera]